MKGQSFWCIPKRAAMWVMLGCSLIAQSTEDFMRLPEESELIYEQIHEGQEPGVLKFSEFVLSGAGRPLSLKLILNSLDGPALAERGKSHDRFKWAWNDALVYRSLYVISRRVKANSQDV
jgi:hypothetical protein